MAKKSNKHGDVQEAIKKEGTGNVVEGDAKLNGAIVFGANSKPNMHFSLHSENNWTKFSI